MVTPSTANTSAMTPTFQSVKRVRTELSCRGASFKKTIVILLLLVILLAPFHDFDYDDE
jgi:hypothetical protein